MTEEQLQAACFIWFWNSYPSKRKQVFHIDNNSVNRIVGNRKRSLGVTKDVADICIIGNKTLFFVEMKTAEGVLRVGQKEFGQMLLNNGHYWAVCRDKESWVKIIKACYGEPECNYSI